MKPPRIVKRRSGAEVCRLLLDEAVDAFAREGFAGAATRRIAERAGVHETVIFRYFGTKAGLYDAAVLGRSRTMIDSVRWPTRPGQNWGGYSGVAEWVRHVDVAAVHHRAPLLALLSPGLRSGLDLNTQHRVRAVREELFRELENGAQAAFGRRIRTPLLSELVHATFATLVGLTAGDPCALMVSEDAKSAARRHDQIVGLISRALFHVVEVEVEVEVEV